MAADQSAQFLGEAIALQRAGQFTMALLACRRALKAAPARFDCNYLMAVLHVQAGDVKASLPFFDAAVRLDPTHAEAKFNYAYALNVTGRDADAIPIYREILGANPGHADARLNYANSLKAVGAYEQALQEYDGLVAKFPRRADLHCNRGATLDHVGRHDEALASFETALGIDPNYVEVHFNRGIALKNLGRFELALHAFDEALKRRPDYAQALLNRGLALVEANRYEEAIKDYTEAIRLVARYAEAYNNRGVALHELKRYAEALKDYDKALAAKPDYAEAHSNRGRALHELFRYQEALSSYDVAIAIRPDYSDAINNRGVTLKDLNRVDEALASFERALELAPASADAALNRALIRLLRGDFEGGLADFEARKRATRPAGNRMFDAPFWDCEADIRGKTILLHYEQGLGDSIHFSRYADVLAQRGARVLLAPHPQLRGLLAGQFDCEIVDLEKPLPPFDFHCPLLSAPFATKTRLDSIPARESYLRAEEARVKMWRERLGAHGLKIGICWQGSTARIDVGRSFQLAEFAGVSRLPGVRLISLHKGAGESQIGALPEGMCIETLGPDFDSGDQAFLDSAAVIDCCDLVITSDTAIAHLAGALGAKTWVALRFNPDWRWLLDRDTSPWYPTMRLFRQPEPGAWGAVFRNIEHALAEQGRP